MARIEISIEEYELLKTDNAKLYAENVELRKTNEKLKQDTEQVQNALNEIKESSLFERIFKWGYLYSILEAFSSDKTTEENEKTVEEIDNNINLDIEETNE